MKRHFFISLVAAFLIVSCKTRHFGENASSVQQNESAPSLRPIFCPTGQMVVPVSLVALNQTVNLANLKNVPAGINNIVKPEGSQFWLNRDRKAASVRNA